MIVEATKLCGGCGRSLSLSNFHKHRSMPDGLQSRCKSCKKQYYEAYYSNPETKARLSEGRKKYSQSEGGKKWRKEWEAQRKEALGPARKRRCAQIRRVYKVDATFAERLIDVPVCQSCGAEFAHLGQERIDHCHENGHVRGVLCNACNIATGGPAEVALHRLRSGVRYLERDLERQCRA
jgi:hypothetical protein